MADVDLRRAARMVAALTESDYEVVRLVMVEVQREHSWQAFAMAMAAVARMLTLDEPARPDVNDTAAFTMWLHGAVEHIATEGDAWWLSDPD
jgi:hypothetical protein